MTDQLTVNYKFQQYCVLFADILNQAEKIDQLRNVPTDKDQLPSYLEKLRQTAGVNFSIAQIFNKNFELLNQVPQKFSKSPEAVKNDFIARTSHPISRQLFSDSMLYYLPLSEEQGQCPEWAIYKLFFATYTTYLYALEVENPLRGAITFGYAGIFGENGLYGPVLLDAYRIESSLARYPRIVVETSLIKKLQASANQQISKDIQTKLSAYFSKKCLELIVEDSDGLYVIDPQARHNKEYQKIHEELREKAKRFITSELIKFQSQKNYKLSGRYQDLLNLFSSNKP
jgi:hypothetical protein